MFWSSRSATGFPRGTGEGVTLAGDEKSEDPTAFKGERERALLTSVAMGMSTASCEGGSLGDR